MLVPRDITAQSAAAAAELWRSATGGVLVDDAFAQELEAVDWFAACGRSVAVELPVPASQVSGWAEAARACASQPSRFAALEARNALTGFLSAHHRSAYRRWNAITRAAKARVVTPLMDRVWRPFAERHKVGSVVVDRAAWDVLAAVMEHEYRGCEGRPVWFLHLLRVYRAGHFPCGWSGEWPAGQLLVW